MDQGQRSPEKLSSYTLALNQTNSSTVTVSYYTSVSKCLILARKSTAHLVAYNLLNSDHVFDHRENCTKWWQNIPLIMHTLSICGYLTHSQSQRLTKTTQLSENCGIILLTVTCWEIYSCCKTLWARVNTEWQSVKICIIINGQIKPLHITKALLTVVYSGELQFKSSRCMLYYSILLKLVIVELTAAEVSIGTSADVSRIWQKPDIN